MSKPAPLETRLRIQAHLFVEAWQVWIESMAEAYYKRLRTSSADTLLRCLAEGASRYARAPNRPARRIRSDVASKMITEVTLDGRDGMGALVEEMLVRSVHAQCLTFAAEGVLDQDTRAMLPSLQVSAIRVAATRVLAPIMPAQVALDTLDHYLRETMPSEVTWWDDPDRGVAEALGSD
jgi:hypothetical protein